MVAFRVSLRLDCGRFANWVQVSIWQSAVKSADATSSTSPTYELSGHTGSVTALSWATDGALLASGSSDGSVILWNGTTRARVGTLQGLGCGIASVAFQPAAQYVAAGDSCGCVRTTILPFLFIIAGRTGLRV